MALAAVKAVAMVLLWTGAAIWRATFVRSARVKARCAIFASGYEEKAFLEGEKQEWKEETGRFFHSPKVGVSLLLLSLAWGKPRHLVRARVSEKDVGFIKHPNKRNACRYFIKTPSNFKKHPGCLSPDYLTF